MQILYLNSRKKAKSKIQEKESKSINSTCMPVIYPVKFTGAVQQSLYVNGINSLKAIIKRDRMLGIPVIKDFNTDFIFKLQNLTVRQPRKSYLVGITGASGSGKSFFSEQIQKEFRDNVTILHRDDYIKDYSKKIKEAGGYSKFLNNLFKDFNEKGITPDDPDTTDFKRLKADIQLLAEGKEILGPKRDKLTGIVEPYSIPKKPSKLIITEGINMLDQQIKDIFDLKIFVDIPEELCRLKYIQRAPERNKTREQSEMYWNITNYASKKYILPTKNNADLVINGHANSENMRPVIKGLFGLFL